MPFDPTYPAPNAELLSGPLRDQLLALHDETQAVGQHASRQDNPHAVTIEQVAGQVAGGFSAGFPREPGLPAALFALNNNSFDGFLLAARWAEGPRLFWHVGEEVLQVGRLTPGGAHPSGFHIVAEFDLAGRLTVGAPVTPAQAATKQYVDTAVAYVPGHPAHWQAPGPATVAEALDRLAAAASQNGANPI